MALLLVVTAMPAVAQDDGSAGLMARIQQLRADVAAAELAVADYRAAHPELASKTDVEQRIALTLAQLATIDSEAARSDAQLQSLKTLNDAEMTSATVAATGDASLMMLLQARDGLQAERSELSKTFGRAHPTMVQLQARLNAAQQALASAAAGALQSMTAEVEARAERRSALEITLAELQSADSGSVAGNAELSRLERAVDTARLQLEMHLAQYMAPVAPPAAEEPLLAVPLMPERPAASGLQALILPVGIGVAALLALALQGAIVKRLSYRKGFADGRQQAELEHQHIAAWRDDEAETGAETDVPVDRQIA